MHDCPVCRVGYWTCDGQAEDECSEPQVSACHDCTRVRADRAEAELAKVREERDEARAKCERSMAVLDGARRGERDALEAYRLQCEVTDDLRARLASAEAVVERGIDLVSGACALGDAAAQDTEHAHAWEKAAAAWLQSAYAHDAAKAGDSGVDPRPLCVECGKPWVPPEGFDATVEVCPACELQLHREAWARVASRLGLGSSRCWPDAVRSALEAVTRTAGCSTSDVAASADSAPATIGDSKRPDPHDEPDAAVVVHFSDAHDGPGWYYYSEEYPDEGCCGRFDSQDECMAHASQAYKVLHDEHGKKLRLPVPVTIGDVRRVVAEACERASERFLYPNQLDKLSEELRRGER